mgnify:CR=1 FL=1
MGALVIILIGLSIVLGLILSQKSIKLRMVQYERDRAITEKHALVKETTNLKRIIETYKTEQSSMQLKINEFKAKDDLLQDIKTLRSQLENLKKDLTVQTVTTDFDHGVTSEKELKSTFLSPASETISPKYTEKNENNSWEQKIKRNTEIFNQVLLELPKKEVVISNEIISKKRENMINCPIIKITNITKTSPVSKLKDYVVIDTETTGLKASTSRILELSAIRFVDFQPVECMTTLVNPCRAIPESSTRINGITDDMVKDKPEFYQIRQSFVDFIGKSSIVGHNITFDLQHLFASRMNLIEKRKIYDTLILARKSLDILDSYSLSEVCSFFNLERDNAHRALSDCLATGIIFKKLVQVRVDDLSILEYNNILQ